MSKKLELNSYSRNDENDRDYVVYEVKHIDGYKEYVSRSVFRKLKALEIIKEKRVNVQVLHYSIDVYEYNKRLVYGEKQLTQEEYDLLKEELYED